MKTLVLIALLFISFGIKAQEPSKKESSAPAPSSTSQERAINEKGIPASKPKSKSNANAKTTPEPAPAPAPPPTPPVSPAKEETTTKPE